MKNLLILALTILIGSSSYARDWPKYEPRDIKICPMSSEYLLEVTKFIPSADSNSSKGICYVKVNSYSWWDLIGTSDSTYEVEVNAGVCNSNDFSSFEDKLLIKATVSYKGNVTMCRSNPGCHYECKPIVALWSF